METDRELLELAAKAAGIKALRGPDGIMRDCTGCDPAMNIFAAKPWHPLTDDGDALRLAVKLNIHIAIDAESAGVIGAMWNFDESGTAQNIVEEDAQIGGDDYAATRRAIVRAAAAIGEQQ